MLEKPLLDMIMTYAFFSGIILIPLSIVSALYDTFKLRLRPDTLAKEELTPFQKGDKNPLVKENHVPTQTVQVEKVTTAETEPWYDPDNPDFLKEFRQPPEPEPEIVEIPITEEKPQAKAEETKTTKKPVEALRWEDLEDAEEDDVGAFQIKRLGDVPVLVQDSLKLAETVETTVWVKMKKGFEEESDLTGLI